MVAISLPSSSYSFLATAMPIGSVIDIRLCSASYVKLTVRSALSVTLIRSPASSYAYFVVFPFGSVAAVTRSLLSLSNMMLFPFSAWHPFSSTVITLPSVSAILYTPPSAVMYICTPSLLVSLYFRSSNMLSS